MSTGNLPKPLLDQPGWRVAFLESDFSEVARSHAMTLGEAADFTSHWVNKCINESLRLIPPGFSIDRDEDFGDAEECNCQEGDDDAEAAATVQAPDVELID